ncbi:hypothetical protein [Bosea sp. (in: a-proteobacteria)]|uniref:hypothetical protein n=1 Tax=Bosea sp. (in: a-proteobacteria) TaxID=1871050 RepID=UPI0040333595
MSAPPETHDPSLGYDLPLHVALSEDAVDPKARRAVAGASVRLGGKIYDFSPFIEFYGSKFTARVVESFTRIYIQATPSTTEKRASNLKRILLCLAKIAIASKDESAIARVYKKLRDSEHASISHRDMADAVETVIRRLRDISDFSIVSTENVLTRQNIIESASPMLQDLAREGLWPDVGPLKGIPGSRETRGSNVPSLGELMREGEQSDARRRDIQTLNRKRLKRLREICEDELLREEAAFDRRQRMMDESPIPLERIRQAIREICDLGTTRGWDTPASIECFPYQNIWQCQISFARYFSSENNGTFRLTKVDSALWPIIYHCGGTDVIQKYIEPSTRALVAAYCIVMIDTGLNPQPCDHLAADPFVGQARFGKVALRTIGTTKNRAGYKSIEVDVLDGAPVAYNQLSDISAATIVPHGKVSTVKAIEIWQKLSEPTRRIARAIRSPDAEYLWIVRNGSTKDIIIYKHSSWKDWWASLLSDYKDDTVIGRLPIQRKMIRPTVIQMRAIQNSVDAAFVGKFGHHSTPNITMRRYLNRDHINDVLDERIRKFQNLFESVLVEDPEYAAEMLAIDPKVMRERRDEAVSTGLGFVCANPNAGIQPGTEGGSCSKLDACSTCPMMRFSPSQEAMLGLVLFKRGLADAEEEFIARNPDRWARVWLPGLALCIAIEQRIEGGPKKRMLDAANDAADRGLAAGHLVLFKPW